MNRRITSEQFTSAHESLTAAGIKHGETAEVEMAVGVIDSKAEAGAPHLAYCSGWVNRIRTVKPAGFFERRKPIAGDVEIVNESEVLNLMTGKTGILYFTGEVHSNGHVTMKIDPESIDFMPVQDCERPSLNRSSMKPASLRFIKAKKKEAAQVC